MLLELAITNFAIIEKQTISFSQGLNVISGETGAGKSVVLEALFLLLGGRGSVDFIRSGAVELEVQALFDLSELPEEVRNSLPDIAQGEELLISRALNQDGRNKVLINGRLGSVAVLQDLAARLINICSQNQHVRLLDPKYHIELIDGFVGNEASLKNYREFFESWKEKSAELKEWEDKRREIESRLEDLTQLADRLTKIGLKPGLREELEDRIKKLSNAERLLDGAARVNSTLNDEESGIFQRLAGIAQELTALSKIDPSLQAAQQFFSTGRSAFLELEAELSNYSANLEHQPTELEDLREKLSELSYMVRRYRLDELGLIGLLEKTKSELQLIQGGVNMEELQAEVEALYSNTKSLAEKISNARKRGFTDLAKLVCHELAELNMKDARLECKQEAHDLTVSGADRIEFLISTNKGEPAKQLRQVASGGELSRIMLVLKKILRDRSGVNVLVFDEIDTGISGAVARAVGEKLKELAVTSQVLCITHLPQVASLADRHLLVNKSSSKRIGTQVTVLSYEERVDEIARMLSGYTITASSRESAKELLASKPRT